MKIQVAKEHLYIKVAKPKAGILDTSSKNSAIELAEVLDVGEGVDGYKKGDNIFVKSWAIDVVNYENEVYLFVDINTRGIKAIVK